ncbi:InlB B-repeat-containing protein [Halanaerobacter jeridensis]|uniref:Fibronectin type-III domain-containing protein n=1 Tax=Halanaerobacter jeridensis TaxID=706427 RepID=A0A939BTB1_9FIRM|nr:hypothetical protein [Halanaerobacter jeridensis]MBM7558066.1 hypothetical protein [Halanaerobacter jeridensis]
MKKSSKFYLILALLLLVPIMVGCSDDSGGTTKYTLSIEKEGSGTVEPTEGSHKYKKGTSVPLSASGNGNYYHEEWQGDGISTSQDGTTKVLMNQDRTVKAIFSAKTTSEKSVSDAESLKTEINNINNGDNIDTLILTNSFSVSSLPTIQKSITLDLNNKTLTANVNIMTTETKTIKITSGKIDGDLTVDAANAELENNAVVTGKTDIQNVSNNSFYNSGQLNELVINDGDGCSVNNQSGSSVNSIEVSDTAKDVTIENDNSKIENGIDVKGENTKISNKSGTTVKGKVNVSGKNTQINNQDSNIEAETTIEDTADGTKVSNQNSTVQGNINVEGENTEIENNDSNVESEININANNTKVRNEAGSVKNIKVGNKAQNASIENSGSIDNVNVDNDAKDSTTVINEGTEAEIKETNVEALEVTGKLKYQTKPDESVSLPVVANENAKIKWNGAYKISSDGSSREVTDWTKPDNGKVQGKQLGTIEYRGVIVQDGTETKRKVSMRLLVRKKSTIGIDFQDGPEQVQNLTAELSSGEINLTWDAGTDAENYLIYRSQEDDFSTAKRVTNAISNNNYIDQDVAAGSYYYWVEAYDANGLASEISESVSVNVE